MEAQQAINTLLDTELKGRLIFVREDREAAGEQAADTNLGRLWTTHGWSGTWGGGGERGSLRMLEARTSRSTRDVLVLGMVEQRHVMGLGV